MTLSHLTQCAWKVVEGKCEWYWEPVGDQTAIRKGVCTTAALS